MTQSSDIELYNRVKRYFDHLKKTIFDYFKRTIKIVAADFKFYGILMIILVAFSYLTKYLTNIYIIVFSGTSRVIPGINLYAVINMIIEGLLIASVIVIILDRVNSHLKNYPFDPYPYLERPLTKMVPVALIYLLPSLLLTLFFVLAAVFGVGGRLLTNSTFVSLLAWVLMIVIMVPFFIASPILLANKVSFFAAISKSRKLMKRYMLMLCIMLIFVSILEYILDYFDSDLIKLFWTAFKTLFLGVLSAVVYHELTNKEEGAGIERP